jgi:hypothetical protein
MSSIIGPELTRQIFQYLLQQLDNLKEMGFTENEIAEIQQSSWKDLLYLQRVAPQFLTFRGDFDRRCFYRHLTRSHKESLDKSLADEFLRHGALSPMMWQYFAMAPTECTERRGELGLSGTFNGRPSGPTAAEESAIGDSWREQSAYYSPVSQRRELYLAVAKQTTLPLSIIWQVIEPLQPCAVEHRQRKLTQSGKGKREESAHTIEKSL